MILLHLIRSRVEGSSLGGSHLPPLTQPYGTEPLEGEPREHTDRYIQGRNRLRIVHVLSVGHVQHYGCKRYCVFNMPDRNI